MKIGIELNNIVRDINKQIVKYYKKDIDKSFDDKNVNYNVLNIILLYTIYFLSLYIPFTN